MIKLKCILFKKSFPILLSIVLIGVTSLAFSSCGNNKTKSTSSVDSEETYSEGFKEFNTDPTIKKTVLVDNKRTRITATKLEYYESTFEVTLEIKNKTNKTLTVSKGRDPNSVNNYISTDGRFSVDVEKKDSVKENLSFDTFTLQLCGINEIANIDLSFTIHNDYDDIVNIPPKRIETSIYNTYDFSKNSFVKTIQSPEGKAEYQKAGTEIKIIIDNNLLSEENITVKSATLATNEKDKKIAIVFEVENNKPDTITFGLYDLKINGKIIKKDLIDTSSITTGKTCLLTPTFSTDELKSNDISINNIKEISFTINPYYEPLENKKLSFNV